jgi:hypothetical protein
MRTLWIAAAIAVAAWSASRPAEILFERVMIDAGASETAAVIDINGDGRPDGRPFVTPPPNAVRSVSQTTVAAIEGLHDFGNQFGNL